MWISKPTNQEIQMIMALLVTEAMKPIPEAIEVLHNWDFVAIYIKGGYTAGGDHMYIEGEEKAIADWLRPFDGVWRTKPGTAPQSQQFEVVHVTHEPTYTAEQTSYKSDTHTEFCGKVNA